MLAAGTFSDLHDYAGAARQIGFAGGPGGSLAEELAAAPSRAREGGARGPGTRRLRTEDLIAYGMLAELLGRLPVRVQLDPLTEDELCAVLTLPQGALVREYEYLLRLDDVKLNFSDAALREIARAALAQRCGARGLRSLMEVVCEELMFEAPERRGETIHLTVLDGDTPVGITTSGTFSPSLKAGIALALLDTAADIADGARVTVDVRGRALECEVVAPPFVAAKTR